jgi:hypothetical protein
MRYLGRIRLGDKKADLIIQEELLLADIQVIPMETLMIGREIPISVAYGKLGEWNFIRGPDCWTAQAINKEGLQGKGLPLEVAIQMYEKQYPVIGKSAPEIYGQAIRVTRDRRYKNPHPERVALYGSEVMSEARDWLQKLTLTQQEVHDFCESRSIKATRFINWYEIETQLGLNEFARTIRKYEAQR